MKRDLLYEMKVLEAQMITVANMMQHVSDQHYQQHSDELYSAADMLNDWIKGVQEKVLSEGAEYEDITGI